MAAIEETKPKVLLLKKKTEDDETASEMEAYIYMLVGPIEPAGPVRF